MSAISAVFGPFGATDAVVRAMLARMPQRGDSGAVIQVGGEATLGVARFAWEREAGHAGPVDVARHAGLVVAADAALYYQADLRARLAHAGARPVGTTPSHLILAAYRTWGASCTRYLEGDYAFVVWDGERDTAFCCRDGIGLRPLYYGVFDRTLVVASSVAGVLAHPHASDELDLKAIAAPAAGQLSSLGTATSFRHVHVLPPGHAFTCRSGVVEGPTRHWIPAADPAAKHLSFGAAAAELRRLLTEAVRQRLPASGVAAVWMSGGWDSTAVFAAGRDALRTHASPGRLRPVSISYPEGDPGREDDFIHAVLRHWDTDATWLDSREMPLLEAPERDAAARDEAPALLYGPWNAALAGASRASGARVAFDGNGGDQLFGPSYCHFADLLSSGRWIALVRELVARRALGARELAVRTLLPLVPAWLLPATAWLRPSRRPLHHYFERPLPHWVRRDFVTRERLRETESALLPAHGLAPGRRERQWMLTASYIGWGMSRIAERALAQGVELRSPLLDQRLVAFALSRPWHERSRRGETKRLLRAAMRDLLPAGVLAPRPVRTGVTTGYSRAWMRRHMPGLCERTLRTPLELERLGIVDGAALRHAADRFTAGQWTDDFTRVHLYHTFEVELWLRARRSAVSAAAGSAPAASGDRPMAMEERRSQLSHPVSRGG